MGEVDEKEGEQTEKGDDSKTTNENSDKKEEETSNKPKTPEPLSFTLANPSRVTPEQERFVSFDMQQRYVPVNPWTKPVGIVMLVDQQPDSPEEVSKVKFPTVDGDDEAEPPEPFEWSPD